MSETPFKVGTWVSYRPLHSDTRVASQIVAIEPEADGAPVARLENGKVVPMDKLTSMDPKSPSEEDALYEEICALAPDLRRRLSPGLGPALLERILKRVRAEADGAPVVPLVNALAARQWEGGQQPVEPVGHDGGGMDEDPPRLKQMIERIEAVLADGGPEDEVGIVGQAHGERAPETGDLAVEVGEGDVLPAGNELVDGGFHAAENADRAGKGQGER
jgi:hypothetical protein